MQRSTRRRDAARQFLAIVPLAIVLAACATNPATRRATLIADADRDAKQAVAAESRLDVSSIPSRSIAVLPFSVVSSDTLLAPLGFGLAEMLATDLSVSPQLQTVERLRIDAILRELKVSETGVTDPATAPRTGRLIGARRLLMGSAIPGASGTIQLRARVVDVVDGTTQELVSAEAPMARVFEAERSLALLLYERLGINLTPAQRTQIEQRQPAQLATVLAFGRGVQADARGDAIAATAAYAEASRLDASFVATQAHAGAGTTSASSRSSSVQRVIALSNGALNQPSAARVSEAADAPLPASLTIGVIITIRVTP